MQFNEESVRQQVGAKRDAVGSLTFAGQARVKFRMWAVLDGPATEERGYPCFRDAIFFSRRDVERGKEDGVDREATPQHFQEYPDALEEFKAWMQNPQIPVQALPYLSAAVQRLLDAGNIRTVQELALAPNLIFRDHEGKESQRVSIDAVPELKEPRELAKEWLSKRPMQPLAVLPETETEKLRREIDELRRSFEAPAAESEADKLARDLKDAAALLQRHAKFTDLKTGITGTLKELTEQGLHQEPTAPTVKRGGRVKGSKNKPKATPDAKDAEADS